MPRPGLPVLLTLLLPLLIGACAPTLQPPGPGPTAPRLDGGSIVMDDGRRLPLRTWATDGPPPRAVMLALHGFNDYSNAFDEPARTLAKDGIQVYAYDQRGFGKAPHAGYWPGQDRLVDDAIEAARLLKARHPDVPLYFLGESMGGAVAMVALTRSDRPPVDGAVLSAPAVWGGPHISAFRRKALNFFAHAIPWFPLSAQGIQLRASDNEEALRRLAHDPLVLKVTRVDALHGLVGLMDAAAATPARLTAPLLFLYGIKDDIIPRAPTLDAIDRLPAPPAGRWRVAVYPNGYHLLLRDKAAPFVLNDIAHWVADPRAPLPSGADNGGLAALRAEEKADR